MATKWNTVPDQQPRRYSKYDQTLGNIIMGYFVNENPVFRVVVFDVI